MELTLVDVSNPIHKWKECARFRVEHELDEESSEIDASIPSSMVTATSDPRDLQRRTRPQSVSHWAQKNIGDSHNGKRKTYAMRQKRQSKKLKGRSVRYDATT
jgi:hypothetical protein